MVLAYGMDLPLYEVAVAFTVFSFILFIMLIIITIILLHQNQYTYILLDKRNKQVANKGLPASR